MIQCIHENNHQNLAFPSKEKELQILCDSLGIANTAKTEITIGTVHNDEKMTALLSGKTVNLDELNFLTKRLDSFDKNELTTFFAVAYAEKTEIMSELINLSFNTYCYSVVADFSDPHAMGRQMYLTEQGAVSTEEFQSFDGQGYFEKILAENSHPLITPYVTDVTWTALKNGLPMELSEVLDGQLTVSGGKVKFAQTGSITLIATVKNSRGVTMTQEQTVSIYPVVAADFILPGTAHTDTAIAVDLKTENLGGNAVTWSLKCDGKEIALSDAVSGELTTDGGTVLFKQKGSYTLTASITDELGKIITAADSITVYPVAEVVLTLPAVSHTDKTVTLKTETKEADGLELNYTLTKNGKPVEISADVEGNPADGAIRFKEKGVYALTVFVTDAAGRVFADTANITVYPVGSAGFYLPEIFHTDKTIIVEAMFGEIGSHTARWSLTRDGKEVALSDSVKGTLTNTGGELQFKEKGNYRLMAEFTDYGGRTYRYEQSFKVYPVPSVSYSLPKYAHTDSSIAVKTETNHLDGLTIEWLVDNAS